MTAFFISIFHKIWKYYDRSKTIGFFGLAFGAAGFRAGRKYPRTFLSTFAREPILQPLDRVVAVLELGVV